MGTVSSTYARWPSDFKRTFVKIDMGQPRLCIFCPASRIPEIAFLIATNFLLETFFLTLSSSPSSTPFLIIFLSAKSFKYFRKFLITLLSISIYTYIFPSPKLQYTNTMQSTTRMISALALWVISMGIFILSSPFHVRPVRAFTIQSRPMPSRHNIAGGVRSSLGPLFVVSSETLRHSAAEILSQPQNTELHDPNIATNNDVTRTTTSATLLPVSKPLTSASKKALQLRKKEWFDKSVKYYSTLMREETRKAKGQLKHSDQDLDTHKRNFSMAKRIYFAKSKIYNGQLNHAETIYRKLIDEIMRDEECDHAQLATSFLLLALLLQRTNRVEETRALFVQFFKIIFRDEKEGMECTCCAKVLQAFALFEMKQGNKKKSYRLAMMAIKMDKDLEPLLTWKQFRDAKALVNSSWSA